jgi:hypothetical protein
MEMKKPKEEVTDLPGGQITLYPRYANVCSVWGIGKTCDEKAVVTLQMGGGWECEPSDLCMKHLVETINKVNEFMAKLKEKKNEKHNQ